MKRITLVWIHLTIFIGLFSQISDVLDPSRVFVEEWQDAGSSALKQVNEIEQFFLVTDYGLVGDGDTDNSAQLLSLLDRTLVDRFSMLYFPEGTYIFNYSIQIDYDRVIIKGAGSDKTIFSFWLNEAPYFDPLFSVYNQSYVGFEDLCIWTSNQQNEGNPITIMLNRANNCWLEVVSEIRTCV